MSDFITVQINRTDAEWLRGWIDREENERTRTGSLRIAAIARTIIAALPPEEPTKRGAVVVTNGLREMLHLRLHDDDWLGEDGLSRTWGGVCDKGVPVIVFEGVPKGDYSGRYPYPGAM